MAVLATDDSRKSGLSRGLPTPLTRLSNLAVGVIREISTHVPSVYKGPPRSSPLES
ncbi:hypothetical protein M378DRAFT_155043 [Amanita muscaria Koide BX008]|uniref:Uncharacterized protein n=1 Tax=Amanita muscaria (strain Koide BX008) TaxID=946122 RepID=A0A0C2TVT7_AMAMK|nr:hypothetical protein M378DRAFT_155043 [Amanita muscaria Koide BX008]